MHIANLALAQLIVIKAADNVDRDERSERQ
jgi:hypothetical protein